jgi:hypothetical protein
MSCSSNKCKARSVPDLKDMKKVHNPYCTARTINEPRDSYNQGIFDYRTLQDAYVHHTAQKQFHKSSGYQGCLGCDGDKPVCPTQSGIAFPSHVNTETKLRGL